MKIRRKMIQAEFPLITNSSEKENVQFLLGLINHATYGTTAERMLSTDLTDTVEQAHESLENHSLMVAQNSSESCYHGMPAPGNLVVSPTKYTTQSTSSSIVV